MEHTPTYAPEITVKYTIVEPAQRLTRNQPGFDMQIEIDEILVHGQEISESTQADLLTVNEGAWITEIQNQIDRREVA